MKVLNLYAGVGGNRKLWKDVEVTAVEMEPEIAALYQDYFPEDKVIVGDAHEYLLEHFQEFDFIWSSPPCTTHTRINKNFGFIRYPDMKLYQEIILLSTWFKGKWVVENVIPYYGEQLGIVIAGLLPQQHNRHLYWSNFKIRQTDKRSPEKQMNMIATKSKKAGKTVKTFIDNDDDESLAKRLGFEYIRPVYGPNHSKGQIWRNAVHPKDGLIIFECAKGVIPKQNEKQIDLFE